MITLSLETVAVVTGGLAVGNLLFALLPHATVADAIGRIYYQTVAIAVLVGVTYL